MLKHTKSLEISDIPRWEVPHLGIFPWNPISGVRICLVPILICPFPLKVSFVTVTLTTKCWGIPNHLRKLIFQVWKSPYLEYSYEIKLDLSKYAQYPHKYVCFHYKCHLSQLIYLINVDSHQITWNKWYSKLENAPSCSFSMKSN